MKSLTQLLKLMTAQGFTTCPIVFFSWRKTHFLMSNSFTVHWLRRWTKGSIHSILGHLCGFWIHKERLLIDLFLVSRSSLCMMPAMSLSSAADTIPEAKSLKPSKAADMGQLIEAAFSCIQWFRQQIAFPSDATIILDSILSVLSVNCD